MYNAADLRKGLKIEVDGEPYMVADFEFCKPGKGQSLYRCRLKHMLTGSTVDRTFRSVDRIDKPDLSEREMIYSFEDGEDSVFIDAESYEQVHIPNATLGDSKYFLAPDMECSVLFYRNRPVEVTLPIFVEKRIVKTDPGVRGDTATNVTKPAWIENGYEIQVPIFLNEGDLVRIDTRTGQYSERVSKA